MYLSSSREHSVTNGLSVAVKVPNTPLGKSPNPAVF